MLLSIIIPVYNEEKTIRTIIKRVAAAPLPQGITRELLVVDDRSSDATPIIVRRYEERIRLFRHSENRGKGAALKTGIRHARGSLVLFQDADLEYDPNDYPSLLEPILRGETEVVIGVRIQPRPDSRRRDLYLLHWLGNNLITWTTNLLYGARIGEYEGGYKVLTKKLLDSVNIQADGFDFDNELICKILKNGHQPLTVPIRYRPRGYALGKKIRWRDGLQILWTICKYRFVD